MKTLRIYIALLLSLASVSIAQTHIETRMTLKNEFGKIFTVVFGVDTSATDGVDEKLGEIAAPSFHPVDVLHSAFVVVDAGDRVFSYKDFRPMQKQQFYMIEHELSVAPAGTGRGNQLIFTWAYPLQSNIDSIVVTDYFDGIIAKFKFSAKEADTLNGNAGQLERFKIRVYYNFTPVSVKEELENQRITLYPNPSKDNVLHLTMPAEYKSYVITDIRGEQLLTGEASNDVDISVLAQGTYLMYFYNGERTIVKRFVKL